MCVRSIYSPQICSGDSYHENDLSISILWCRSLLSTCSQCFHPKHYTGCANMIHMYVCIVGCGCVLKIFWRSEVSEVVCWLCLSGIFCLSLINMYVSRIDLFVKITPISQIQCQIIFSHLDFVSSTVWDCDVKLKCHEPSQKCGLVRFIIGGIGIETSHKCFMQIYICRNVLHGVFIFYLMYKYILSHCHLYCISKMYEH